jgi:hypothetical protein
VGDLNNWKCQKNVAAKSFLGMKSSKPDMSSEQRFVLWQDYLKRALHLAFPSRTYVMVDCRQMVGLFQIIFVTDTLSVRISSLESTSTKTGLGGYHGNKVSPRELGHCVGLTVFAYI